MSRECVAKLHTSRWCECECVITPQVEVQREKLSSYFFSVITMYLLTSVLLAITAPYAIKQGSIMDGSTIASLFCCLFVLGRFSHIGQAFVNQVGGVRQVLRVRCCISTLPVMLKSVLCVGDHCVLLPNRFYGHGFTGLFVHLLIDLVSVKRDELGGSVQNVLFRM